MKIIVGLGNPGREYKNTRHNVGYMVLEELARRFPVEKQDSKFDSIIGHIRVQGEKVLLVKPLTFMNLSGRAVQPLARWYKIELQDLMVVFDDMDLPLGVLRIRTSGGSGGHKGMNSIIGRLATTDFPRMRIGIGRPTDREAIDWVLGKFVGTEQQQIEQTLGLAADAMEKWISSGIIDAMNAYN